MRWLLTIVLLSLTVASASAQFRVVKTDGTTVDTILQSIQLDTGVHLNDGTVLAWDNVLRVDRLVPPVAPRTGKFDLHLRGGGKLTGNPVAVVGETLTFADANFGDLAIDLSAIDSMVLTATPQPNGTVENDVLRLTNGDTLRGVLLDLTAEQATLQTTDGQSVTVETDTIARLQLAPLGQTPDLGRWLVYLGEGYACPADAVSLDRQNVNLTVRRPKDSPADPVAPVSIQWLGRIEQVGGPVRFLSDLLPGEASLTPYLSAPGVGAAEPLATDGRDLHVRAHSVLDYELPEGFTRMRIGYVVAAGHRPLADMDVRILLDDAVIHEASGVTPGAPVRLDLDLAQGKRLRLEVDYGKNYDVQDELIWLEPMLLRE